MATKHIKSNIYYTFEANGAKFSVMITDTGNLVVESGKRLGVEGWVEETGRTTLRIGKHVPWWRKLIDKFMDIL
jgi:hypothetical protein